MLASILTACLWAGSTLPPEAPSLAFDVLKASTQFGRGGGYDNKWKGSGTPAEVIFRGETILKKGNGSYCCGYTFTVAMSVIESRKLAPGKTADDVRRFQKTWYGATKASAEKQVALAVAELGVGREVTADEAQAGDFCQFWRGKSGHSVLFLGWVVIDGKKVGISYRSSQGGTDGIGDQVEYFSDVSELPGKIDRNRVYFGRLLGSR